MLGEKKPYAILFQQAVHVTGDLYSKGALKSSELVHSWNFCLPETLQCLLESSGNLPPNVHDRKVQTVIGYYCPSPWDKRSRKITSKDRSSDL